LKLEAIFQIEVILRAGDKSGNEMGFSRLSDSWAEHLRQHERATIDPLDGRCQCHVGLDGAILNLAILGSKAQFTAFGRRFSELLISKP